jgi:hypothetical protein
MKSTNRIRQNGATVSAKSQVEIVSKANELLEPELLEVVSEWDVCRRMEAAEKLGRWSKQLLASADRIKKGAADEVIQKKLPSPSVDGIDLKSIKFKIDGVLEPELLEIAAPLSADQRRCFQKTLQRWADQVGHTILELAAAEKANDKTNLVLN